MLMFIEAMDADTRHEVYRVGGSRPNSSIGENRNVKINARNMGNLGRRLE